VVVPNSRRISVTHLATQCTQYSHRAERHHIDVVDLDPYGTAAPFLMPPYSVSAMAVGYIFAACIILTVILQVCSVLRVQTFQSLATPTTQKNGRLETLSCYG